MEEEGGSILIYILFGIAYIVLQVVGAKKGKKPAHPPVPPQTIPDLEDSEDLPQDATWEEDEKSGMPVPPMPVPDRPVPVPEPETVTAAPFSYDDDITQDYFERARAEQKPENPGNNLGKDFEKGRGPAPRRHG